MASLTIEGLRKPCGAVEVLKGIGPEFEDGEFLRRKPSQLSGGQRQRVDMRTEIKRLHQRMGTTIVYVIHDQIEARP